MEKQEVKGMPEGAYEVLPAGKEYHPYVAAGQVLPEFTVRSVVWGLFMSLLFSAAAAFSGLKIGQVFEAAIPIAIIAVGISPLYRRKNTILENVIIQSIGAASGLVVAGAIFTLPAIFILGLDKKVGIDLIKIFVASFLGGTLGILFLIPFRKYFVKEMHGQFPFPEATATAQILVVGEQGGKQAKVLVVSMLIGAIYDFMVHTVGAFSEVFTSGMKVFKLGRGLYDKAKIVLKFDTLSMVLGLGYIIGLRYSAIITAGSLLAWIILVPLIFHLRGVIPAAIIGPAAQIASMSADEIFRMKVRYIGIGAIATAGIIGVIKSSKIIIQAFGTGFKQLFRKGELAEEKVERTQLDIKMKNVILLLGVTAIGLFVFFNFFILNQVPGGTLKLSLLALLTVFIISFLFTSVAARAIAITGNNPVSGMTLMTLILSSLVLTAAGLRGDIGMLSALMIGGVVCTALAMSGGFITDLKIGYWLGATPLKQQISKFLGTLVASVSVGLVIFLLNKTYGFDPSTSQALAAPQANAMAAVIQALMAPNPQMPWLLLLVGVGVALIVNALKISALAFALGMYLPMELTTPLLIGGLISHLMLHSSNNKELATRRSERGILIASGFIAGGALIGVVSAILKNIVLANGATLDSKLFLGWNQKLIGEPLSLLMFVALCLYLYWDSRRAK